MKFYILKKKRYSKLKDNKTKKKNYSSLKRAKIEPNISQNSIFACDQKLYDSKKICIYLIPLVLTIFNIIFFLFIRSDKGKRINNDIQIEYSSNISNNSDKESIIYDTNFKYEYFENDIITSKIKREAGWILAESEAFFINGIIRKYKLKKCLEIGVASGGSSILILNAIKDFDNSYLVSLDLNTQYFYHPSKKTGYKVYESFPELSKNWKLYTGDQPHIFLSQLNMKFDFLFLDSTHVTPGELINFIEALPFLNENAVVVIHDLLWHFGKSKTNKFFPSNICLFSALRGDKVIFDNYNSVISNIGAVFLFPNQKKYYLDYFLLLLNFWEYIPTDTHISDLRHFIKNYYKDEDLLKIFNLAYNNNNRCYRNFMSNYSNIEEYKRIIVSLGEYKKDILK